MTLRRKARLIDPSQEPIRSSFQRYVNGKRCIFVGPSPIIRGLCLGQYIDSFEVVIRPIGSLWSGESKEDYGIRTDIVYVNSQFARYISLQDNLDKFKEVSFIRTKNTRNDWLEVWNSIKGPNDRMQVDNCVSAFRKIGSEIANPTLGAIAVCDLLEARPECLEITGVDFYSTRQYNDTAMEHDMTEYVSGYIPEEFKQGWLREQRQSVVPPKPAGHQWDIHDHLSAALWYLDKLIKNRIQMSEQIEDALYAAIKKFRKLKKA